MSRNPPDAIHYVPVEARYLAASGGCCPVCLCTDIDAGDTYTESSDVKVTKVSCAECGSTWTDVFNLAGLIDIRVGPRAPHHPVDIDGVLFIEDDTAAHPDDEEPP